MSDLSDWIKRGRDLVANQPDKKYPCAVCGGDLVDKIYQRCRTCQAAGLSRPSKFRDFMVPRARGMEASVVEEKL